MIYEDGIWVPELCFGGSNSGVTYDDVRLGRYVRINNAVILYCRILLTSKGTSEGNVSIEGLPFRVSTPQYIPIVGTWRIDVPEALTFNGLLTGDKILIRAIQNGGDQLYITHGNFVDNSEIGFTISYLLN